MSAVGILQAGCSLPWRLARVAGIAPAVDVRVADVWLRAFYLSGAAMAAHGLQRVDWLLSHPEIDPLWPVAWAPLLPWPLVVWTVSLGFVASMALAGLMPWLRVVRGAAFVSTLLFGALVSSYGKVNHSYHVLTLVSLVLVFLPAPDEPRADERCRDVLFAVLVVALSIYSFSGLSKVLAAALQVWRDQPHAFQADGLARLVAARTAESVPRPVLAALVVHNPTLSAPLHVGAIFLELTSLVVAFRPALWRVWGVALLGMHCGILLVMGISFLPHAHLVTLAVVALPLTAPRGGVRDALFALPWLGPVLRVAVEPRPRSTTLALPPPLEWLGRLFGVRHDDEGVRCVVDPSVEHPRLTNEDGSETRGVLAVASAAPRLRALLLVGLVPAIVWDAALSGAVALFGSRRALDVEASSQRTPASR